MKGKSLEAELAINYRPGPFHARPIEVSPWDSTIAALTLALATLVVLSVQAWL